MGEKFKKAMKGIGAFAWTIHVGPLGVVAGFIEGATKIDGGNIVSDLAYRGKCAAFNSVRKKWGKETKEYAEATGTTSEQIMKKRNEAIDKYYREHNIPNEKAEEMKKGFREGTFAGGETRVPRVHYQEGYSDNPTAFVFSCPGQTEMNLGSVCAGTTGANLSKLLEFCYEARPDVFPYSSKSAYLITNASDIVHFKKLTGDTEADDDEILAYENLRRLRNELSEKRTVICMGERARTAVREAGVSGRVVCFDHHLSNQKINRMYPNDTFEPDLSPAERRRKRIELLAKELMEIV